MGKINKGAGILGGFRGTVGSVVGSNWRGIETMRAVAKPRKGNPTATQLNQQAKFAVGIKFLSAKRKLLEVGFKSLAVKMTGTNNALSNTLKSAITGVYPNYTIDYSKVLLSKGLVAVADSGAAAAGPAGVVSFSWTINPNMSNSDPTDVAVLVVYCEAMNSTAYTIAGPVRSALAGTLAVPGFSGKTVQTWIAFMSDDGKRVSKSVFTGQVNVL